MSQGKDEFIGIGDNLKRLRGRMGLSLSEVANMTGVSKTMLSQIERSESTPTISTIWKISNGLKVKFDTLLDTTPTHLCDIRRIADVTPCATSPAWPKTIAWSPSPRSRDTSFSTAPISPAAPITPTGTKTAAAS